MSGSEHIRAAIIGLWRDECSFASECGRGEKLLAPVLIHLLEAYRLLEGDDGVSAVLAEAEHAHDPPAKEPT